MSRRGGGITHMGAFGGAVVLGLVAKEIGGMSGPAMFWMVAAAGVGIYLHWRSSR